MKAIERIYQYIDYKRINKSDFEKKCGISNGYLGKMYRRNADIGESILVQVIENCPDLSPEWLIIGNGTMIKDCIIEKDISPIPVVIPVADNNSMGFILDRYDALVAKNAVLEKENEELKLSRGKSTRTIPYSDNSQNIVTYIAAETKPKYK